MALVRGSPDGDRSIKRWNVSKERQAPGILYLTETRHTLYLVVGKRVMDKWIDSICLRGRAVSTDKHY